RSDGDGESSGDDDTSVLPVAAGTAAAGSADAGSESDLEAGTEDDAAIDRLFAASPEQPREQSVWSLGAGSATDEDRTATDEDGTDMGEAPAASGTDAADAPEDAAADA